MPTGDFRCEVCQDTGYYGDNGPGIRGNREYNECDYCRPRCRHVVVPLDQWRRLVECVRLCGGRGDRNVEEIHAIIAAVEVPHD